MSVEWVEKPPTARSGRHGKWAQICAQLRERPGVWARCYTNTSTAYATLLKQGKLGNAMPGEFEAVARKNDFGSYDIYARYVGVSVEPEPMKPVSSAFPSTQYAIAT